MTDEEWDQIRPLAERRFNAKRAYYAAQIANTEDTDLRRAIEQDSEYQRLRAEFVQADTALENAKRRLLK